VTDMASLENLIHETICQFGAIDCFISNAGVLRAGGLDDMTPENFDFVTKINYNAYFYCTKMVTKVMKLQTKYARADYYADIIQINSKSGLQGSKANFAYAGGKFGGIGLTQSFALELAPYRIKVNSICPGNFYEGPLWSDPDNGLFVQYLKAGKVPGAKTIEDVKAFYLSKVPMGKGCTPEDVTRGVLYLMDQCGETGQALPIQDSRAKTKDIRLVEMHNFKKLDIWNRSVEFVADIYRLVNTFPQIERFGLVAQMQRAAMSIPTNIAEGSTKSSNKDFARFLEISLGSAYELETELLISFKLSYIETETYEQFQQKLSELQRMINGFKDTL